MEENANYIEVQEWFDGSNMEPSKVDGVIYIIIGSKYYRRRFSNNTVNPLWWGIKDDGNPNQDDGTPNYYRVKQMVDLCVQQSLNIHFPKGEFSCGNSSFPFHDSYTPGNTELRDFKNIIVSGEGRETVLRTDSQTGADVLQLNSIKNITFRDLAVTATVAIKTPQPPNGGSNGVSITNGFDNITLENIHAFDLEGVEYPGYIDGAKAFTIQNGEFNTIPTGKLKLINCSSKNNAYGWRHDGFLSDVMKNDTDIDIDLTIEKSWLGFSLSFADATDVFDESKRINYKGKVTLIDCQQDIILGRLYGGDLNFYIQSDKDETELTKNPLTNQLWKNKVTGNPYDETLFTAYLAYIKHSNIKIFGYKKINHFKYAIGSVGWIIEPHTEGRTENSNLLLQVAGDTIETDELKIVPDESVTDPLFDKAIYRTTIQIENFQSTIPQKLLKEENENLIICNKKIISSSLSLNKINFGDYASASFNEYAGGVKFKQTSGSHGYLSVIEAFSNTDERLFSINNFGELLLKNSTKIVTGDSLPNGNVVANMGSIYLRKVGGASYSIWLKTADDNEFGWKLVPLIETCTSANRPNLTLTEDIGKMIFDTDLGRHIAWTGTKWIKYSFTDA
ncbi:hypothetical protein MQX03_16950 [Chryseobacterium aahli]|uniref:hypothetical protein n=1 Tax=Chryseobacterium aahli TaxID=1278643 RepID=UPI001F617801|nr:hypothetical protein [Chryseobacterium aahli]MCI3938891.1 hypothetical protein [Chryseobacterium aahli]